MSSTNINRNLSIDLLRIISALCIVFIHVTPGYSNDSGLYTLFIQPIIRAGLPLFFIISGYFLLNGRDEPLLEFYRKRFISLLIPFIIFSFIHYTYFHQWDVNAYSYEWGLNYIKSILYGAPVNFGRDYFMTALYWFVYTISGIYVISPAIKKCLTFIDDKKSLKYLLILIGIYGLYQALSFYLSSIGFSKNILSAPENIKWLIYFISGGIICRVKNKINNSAILFIILASYLCVMATCVGASSGMWYGFEWIDGNPSMIVLSISIFILFHKNNLNINNRYIPYISNLTYGVYLVHIMILSIVDAQTKYLGQQTISYVMITSLTVFILSLILSSVINYSMINRIIRLLS